MKILNDLTGKTFGSLEIISRADDYISPKGKHIVRWNCNCKCKQQTVVNSQYLTSGHTTSCGCNKVKSNFRHGMSHSRLYKIWDDIISRTSRKSHKSYINYGGRGIFMCQEWRSDFINFMNWAMSNGYSDNLTIDRIDGGKGYSPDNCRWATMKEQENNTRRNVIIQYNGESHTLSQWAEITGINSKTLQNRLFRSKMEIGYAFTKPVM